ncbi:MAG: bifunctional DNA-formamidopyrimidine glycosylase/DNA-(apurinic or apyrimidinic site) lyase [Bryobacterales bacterium]|nr:bifunctional DNA-formamidopyrimidine glycosylase/DNA-(apurinic or apyrimidinic site) lyase [Bryobacterales bacterium]
METIVRDLAPLLAGRTIVSVEVVAGLVVKTPLDGLAGNRIDAVRRHGKTVVLDCSRGVLTVHLGMTGKLLVDAARSPYCRVVFALDGAALLYDDIRQFGRVHWGEALPAHLAQLGPDPLEIGLAEFVERLRARRGAIKPVLLDQKFLRGLGNIYADECLFRGAIHPRAAASALSRTRIAGLYGAMRETLAQAIAHRGSSISDYVDASGRQGSFQLLHQVYGKEGKACQACGTAIRRIVIAQRGTHYCPRCQRG